MMETTNIDLIDDLSLAEQDAFTMSRAALLLDQGRGDKKVLAQALDHNVQIWSAIRAVAVRSGGHFPRPVKENLTRLADYVTGTTFAGGVELSTDALDSLININLQICEGLLEGQRRAQDATH